MKKKTLKKNPSNRKPISYSTKFRLDINLNNFVRIEEYLAKNNNKSKTINPFFDELPKLEQFNKSICHSQV